MADLGRRSGPSQRQIGVARALCVAARDNIQIHGALGFTWEHDAHLYYRRSIADDLLLGDAAWHRDRLGALLGV